MKMLREYNRARMELESRFTGIPNAHGKLVHLLMTRSDPETGLVENLSCRDLANLLAVDHAPGRKGAGIPKIETIRSYLRTIAKSCPDDFKLINQGQRIACLFINMPKIYAHFCAQKEVYGDNSDVQESIKPLVNTAALSEEEAFFGSHETAEPPIEMLPEAPVKNINILNNNNNNKYMPFSPIADDFVPNPQTIAKAMSLGHSDATDFNVIREFIHYNQAIGSEWVDYNPVYLVFLAKRVERKKLKQQQTQSGRAHHASCNNGKKRQPSARERVKQAHASQFDFCEASGRYHAKASNIPRAYCDTVVATY
jgi:hypothetical protein